MFDPQTLEWTPIDFQNLDHLVADINIGNVVFHAEAMATRSPSTSSRIEELHQALAGGLDGMMTPVVMQDRTWLVVIYPEFTKQAEHHYD